MNLQDSNHYQTIVQRIHLLSGSSERLWGKMNVSQMLEHCTRPFQVALGELELKKTWIGWLFGGIAKRQFLKGTPMTKNLPTDKNFRIHHYPEFDSMKSSLLEYIDKFKNLNEKELESRNHPIFGKLKSHEWATLLGAHLDHHLRQFGV